MHRSRPLLGKAFRAAIVVTVVAVLMNTVIHVGSSGFYATFCAFVLLILADFGGAPVQRFLAYVAAGVAGMVLIVIGAFVAPHLPLALIVTALVTVVLAFSVLLRGYVGTAYVSLLLTYVVAVTTPQPVDTLPTALASFFGGALVAGIAAVTMWPSYEVTAVSKAVGTTLSASARVIAASRPLRADATPQETDADMQVLTAAEGSLAKAYDGNLNRPGTASRRDRGLVQLVDDVTRLRIALRWPTAKTARATPADIALLQAAHDTLDASGKAIVGEGAAPELETIRSARDEHTRQLPRLADELLAERKSGELIERANASFYFRVTALIAEMVARHTRLALGRPVDDAAHPGAQHPGAQHPGAQHPGAQTTAMVDAVTTPGRMLAANLTFSSPWLRRALQTMVAVTIVVAVIHFLHLQEGFWVVLGIATALKLDAATSRKTVWGAALGTLGGFALAVLMLWLVGDNKVLLIVLLPIVSFFAVWFPAGRFELPLKQAGFSLWFIMLVSLAHGGLSIQIDDTRIIDVGIGLLTSLVVTALMWPNGVAARVRAVLTESASATAAYFTAAYDFVTSPMGAPERASLQDTAEKATAARVEAQDAFDVAITQGGDIGRDAAAWTGVASSVDHVYFAAATVRSLPDYGLAPVADDTAGAQLRESARALAGRYVDTIDAEYRRAQADGGDGRRMPGTQAASAAGKAVDLSALSDAVERAVQSYDGRVGELTFEIAPASFTMSYGDAAVSMLWAQDWLLYFRWMATQTESELTAVPR